MANLIASITDVSVTPSSFLPGESIEISVTITAGSAALTGFVCALYGTANDINYLATPLLSKSVSIAANATKTVTIQTTASALAAQPDGRITAFAYAANNSLRGMRLTLGFRSVEKSNGAEQASVGYFIAGYDTPDVAGAFNLRCVPAIDQLVIERASYDAEANVFRPDDEGVRALLSCKTSVQDDTWVNGFYCLLTWGTNTALVCAARAGSIHNRTTDRWTYGNAALLQGLTRSIWPLYDYTFDTGTDYVMTCTYGDSYETATLTYVFHAAFANLNLSGTGKGVAIGKFSGSTTSQPLFEVAANYMSVINGPATFNGDVAIAEGSLFKTISVSKSGSISTGSPTFSGTITVDAGEGWLPIALAGFKINQTWCFVSQCQLTGNGVEFAVRYRGSSSSSQSVAMTANVLCVRTALPTSS